MQLVFVQISQGADFRKTFANLSSPQFFPVVLDRLYNVLHAIEVAAAKVRNIAVGVVMSSFAAFG